MSAGEGTVGELATSRGRDYPALRQFTVFLENRVGQLLEVVRRFEGTRVRIVSISIHESTECAFLRLLLSHPEQGREILERAGVAFVETDLIAVVLPEGDQPLVQICSTLLASEVNIIQASPLLMRYRDRPIVVLMVDNLEIGLETLGNKKFQLLTENQLQELC